MPYMSACGTANQSFHAEGQGGPVLLLETLNCRRDNSRCERAQGYNAPVVAVRAVRKFQQAVLRRIPKISDVTVYLNMN
jgi:hypothetical protein